MSVTTESIYQWKENFSGSKGVDAEEVVREIEQIERAWKVCTPHLLVQRAKDPTSPLHKLFTWSDQEAAERYRVSEARRILSSIRVVVDDAPAPVPAYVHVRTQQEKGHTDKYASIMKALSDADSRASVLREALMLLQGYRKRYSMLNELAHVWAAIDEAAEIYESKIA